MKFKVWKITVIFIIAMIFLTIFSRIADQLVIAKVQTAKSTGSTIDFSIKASGTVTKKEQIVVTAEPDYLVRKIYVSAGQRVKAGDRLIQLDTAQLDASISELQAEIEKLNLAIKDQENTNSVSEANRAAKIARAQEDYEIAAVSGDEAVSKAYSDVISAKSAYEAFYQQYTNEPGQTDRSALDALQKDWEEKQAIYDASLSERDTKIREARRSLEDAESSAVSNSDAGVSRIEKNQKQEQLDKLLLLKSAEAIYTAPQDGVVKSIKTETGDITTAGAAIILDNLSSGSQLELPQVLAQKDDIQIGDEVSVTGIGEDGSTQTLNDLMITSIRPNKEDKSLMDIIIDLENTGLAYGSEATMEKSRKSEYYTTCIPLSALRKDAENHYYILAAREKETILGMEQTAEKLIVEVLDLNTSMAAIQCDSLKSDEEIIIESSKKIEDGSRIRVVKNNVQK